MSTDRRTAANRANAAHSTGPRTAEGKAASSRNAVSHGITSNARVTVFNWESPEEFQQLRDDYCARFRPIDRVEFEIIERMVDATWRRKRAITIETTIYDLEISEIEEEVREDFAETATGPLRLALAFKNRHGDGVWDAIQRLLNTADRCYSRALRDLEKLQKDHFNQTPEPAAPPVEDPEEELAAAVSPSKPKIVEMTKRTQLGSEPEAPGAQTVDRQPGRQNEPNA